MSKQTKQLGGWGLVTLFGGSLLSLVMPLACIIALVGLILTMKGYFRASNELGEPGIKRNTIKAIVVGIIGIVIFIIGAGAVIAEIKEGVYPEDIAGPIMVIVVVWIFWLVATWFWYKANALISMGTNVNLFKKGGLLMFVGTVLEIIVIGIPITLVGEILLIVAWFSVPERKETA